MHDELIIRPIIYNDLANLVILKQQVWVATYAVEGIRTEFSDYLLATFTIENEEKNLGASGKKTLVAESNNHLLGCAEMIFDADCPLVELKNATEISVLYVLECFTRKGIGIKLLNASLEIIKIKGYRYAWLTVYWENTRAIDFYKKHGFKDMGLTFFEMGGNQYENRVFVFDLQKHNLNKKSW